MINDLISDVIARMNNAIMAKRSFALMPHSKFVYSVLSLLNREGFINSCSVVQHNGFYNIKVKFKYDTDGTPAIRYIKRVSKPGRRVYSQIKKLNKIFNGLGMAIISSPVGVLTDKSAREKNTGGEVLFHIF